MSFIKNLTVVVFFHNQKDQIIDCISSVLEYEEITHIIGVDNNSSDGGAELLEEIGCPYVSFDKEEHGAGVLFNSVIDNFELKDYILFINPSFKLNRDSLFNIEKVLLVNDTGIASFKFRGAQNTQEFRTGIQREYSDVISVLGGIFIVKKSVINKVGRFNEELLSEDNVILDYSLRLIKENIRTRVSELSIVTWNGKRNIPSKINNDHNILSELYGMNYFNQSPNYALCNMIDRVPDDSFNVLEVGCDLGATLIEIKNTYKNSKVFGLEINSNSVDIASLFINAEYGNIEKLEIPFKEKYDYIIFGDVLEHLHNTEEVVNYCKSILKPGGSLIVSVPNLMCIEVIEQLLNGNFTYTDTGLLDRTHIHFFTYKEIIKMFCDAGYEVKDIVFSKLRTSERQDKLITRLLELSEETNEMMYKAIQFMLRVQIRD